MFEFQCKKCKKIFPVEQHPLFQSLKDKLSAEPKGISPDEELKAVWDSILEITKQIRCPHCQSPVYLIGIGETKLGTNIDATSEPLVQNIKGLVDLYTEYKSKTSTVDSFLKYTDEVSEYAQAIAEHLMWNPGTLVYFEDDDLVNDAKNAIDKVWEPMS